MMRSAFLVVAAAMCLTADTVPPATDIMHEAQSAAAAQHKSIFLIFHASW